MTLLKTETTHYESVAVLGFGGYLEEASLFNEL